MKNTALNDLNLTPHSTKNWQVYDIEKSFAFHEGVEKWCQVMLAGLLKKKKKFYGHINLGKTSFNKANKDLLKALLYSMGTVTHWEGSVAYSIPSVITRIPKNIFWEM